MKNVIFISKTSNSFGDQILDYLVNGELETHVFEEGSWVDPQEYAEILKGDHGGNHSKKSGERLDSKKEE